MRADILSRRKVGVDFMREIVLEDLICEHLADNGWLYSENDHGYDAKRALFPEDVFEWLEDTQPNALAKRVKAGAADEAKKRAGVLDALCGKLDRAPKDGGGTLNVLRSGFTDVNATFSMCQFKPASSLGGKANADYEKVRLRVMRQVHFSPVTGDNRSLDLVFFINGIPVATAELKSSSKQDIWAAIRQYKTDRDPKGQPLFHPYARALVHFAVDDEQVYMTTQLAGEKTRFLPFNQGNNGRAGNPPNPDGEGTAYLWEKVMQRDAWLNIFDSFVYFRDEKQTDPISGKMTTAKQIRFPRFHQWETVTSLVNAAREEGPGHKYLIQHSAGSGKTDSIAFLALRLARMQNDAGKVFSKVVIVSDRRTIDDQLQNAIVQIDSKRLKDLILTVNETAVRRAGSRSKALGEALTGNQLIMVVTIQTFPYVLDALDQLERSAESLSQGRYAIIIDEAHTSQTGQTAEKVRKILAAAPENSAVEEAEDDIVVDGQDEINAVITEEMAKRAGATNISYFAFTATPKEKTLELFGRPDPADPEQLPKPFRIYTMQQAIEEEYILDVLRGYLPYKRALKITDVINRHEEVDETRGVKAIMQFAGLHPTVVAQKVKIIIPHFRRNVAPLLDGYAKAMIVTDSRKSAVRYKQEIDKYLTVEHITDLQVIVAFSGKVWFDPDIDGSDFGHPKENEATESNMNRMGEPGGIQSTDLAEEFKRREYRVMIAADKFQTGFDQPLLCAMYVDKRLDGVAAVQTLSRLNRTYRTPSGTKKDKTFIVDFVNDANTIRKAFEPYYRDAHVEETTDPNIIIRLREKLDAADVFTQEDVEAFAEMYYRFDLSLITRRKHARAAITPVINSIDARLKAARDNDDKTEKENLSTFRKDLGTYVRMWDFMSQITDYEDPYLEKLAQFARTLLASWPFSPEEGSIDISGLAVQATYTQGTAVDIALTGNEALKPATGAGTGDIRDPRKVALDEIIERINARFPGDFPPIVIEGVVTAVAGTVLSDPDIAQAAAVNALDQFRKSPKVSSAVKNAIIDLPGITDDLITKLLSDPEALDDVTDYTYEYQGQGRDSAAQRSAS